MCFAFPANYRVKIKPNENIKKYLNLVKGLKKNVEYEVDDSMILT